MIPESFIQELLARIDIVDVVEQRLSLKKTGANFQACCPFHSEKTPSFTVSPVKQFYHCFGCGAHGSAIGFIMQYAGLDFVDAVEELAQSVGMVVPHQHGGPRLQKRDAAPLTDYMTRAAAFFKKQLKGCDKAIAYLKSRGLSGDIAARYGLGYAPDDWQPLQDAFDDYNSAALVECGLVVVNENGRRYDRFRDRIMFPIHDQRANIIAFGGRSPGAGEPKYLNSPETPLFRKGEELYGLLQARQHIREAGHAVVVEGYMDVVALAQFGVGNAVATLGTATTPTHVRKLLRQTDHVIFCFDGDSAGRKAAWRALVASLETLADDKTVSFLFLPQQHDPDSFVRAEGAAAFQQLAAHPTTLTDFLMREISADLDLNTAEGRAKLVHLAKPCLAKMSAPLLRAQLTRSVAASAALSPTEVEAQCGLSPMRRFGRPPPPRNRQRPSPQNIERALLYAIVRRPERAARLPPHLINADIAEGAALLALTDAIEHALLPVHNLGALSEYFRATSHESLISEAIARLENDDGDEAEMEAVFNDGLERLREKSIRRDIDALNARARSGQLTPEERRQLAALLASKTS